MTLEEHIARAEEDAKTAEFDSEWGIGNYFIDRTEALNYAKECRQLAEWLKELRAYREARERIKRGLQSCFNMVHCESNHDILEGQETAFKYCIEQLEEVTADES